MRSRRVVVMRAMLRREARPRYHISHSTHAC